MELSGIDHLTWLGPDAVVVIDEETRLRYANRAAERLFGWSAENRLGTLTADLIHPDDVEFAMLSAQTVMAKDVGTPIELRVMTATGWRLVEVIGAPYRAGDVPGGIILSLRDLTERRRWEVAGDDVALFRTLLQNAAAITMLVDSGGTVRAVSAAVTRVLGLDPADVQGQMLADLVSDVDRPRLLAALVAAPTTREPGAERRVNVDVDMKCRDGETMPIQLSVVNLLDDPTVSGLIVSAQDISELQAARRQLAYAAEHDDLTGLPNRAFLSRLLMSRLALDGPRATAVAFLDLDRFKTFNDLFGHEVGDEILVTVARRLQNAVRASDLVTRFGGDEFVVVAPATSEAEVEQMVCRLEQAVSEPMRLRSGRHQVCASIGLVIAHPGDVLADVLAEADSAMYELKNRKRGRVGRRIRPLAERRALAEDLDQAFRMGQFEVHYQPIVDLARGQTFALEALVRWHHPRRGLLLPADFLDVVEDAGRDAELGDLVASTAMSDLGEFAESSRPDLALSVNVSMSQLAEIGFADRMIALVLVSGVNPASVVVEVSERGLLDKDAPADESPVREALQSLSDAGFRIGVEDFGTGCSSLSHLIRFPIDILKIDRSFVDGLGEDESRESIIAALVGLAQAAGLEVVAEGVEHESQIRALRDLGCGHAQGFYFCRPLPPTEMLAELRAQAALADALTERIG